MGNNALDRLAQYQLYSMDELLEFLDDNGYLSEKGKKMKHAFWERYIHNK